MWPCEYCKEMIEIPYLTCLDCYEKQEVNRHILIKRQERLYYYAVRDRKKSRTGHS